MARERSNFETYSMFYENILQQQQQLLYQKEQVAELSHEMIMEVTALRARLADLHGEDYRLKEQIRKEVQEDYGALVQGLFLMCLQLKGKLNQYRLSISRHMFEMIGEVRRDGVDKMIALKKKFGSTKDNTGLKEHLAQAKFRILVDDFQLVYLEFPWDIRSTQVLPAEQLQELRDENSRLGALVCKLKTISGWKETVQKAKLSASLREMEKEAIQNKKECLKYKMMAEQEVVLFRQQLKAARKALAQSQAENKRLKQQLDKQVCYWALPQPILDRKGEFFYFLDAIDDRLLQEAEHRMNQEVHRRQKLNQIKTDNLERMLEDLGDRERKLRCLSAEAEKSSKTRQLQKKKMKKEFHQVKP
ncbi:UNVERIFIED_CONTAM: hypothetical protein K2H54_069211 [Gekko kuhli]